MSDLLDEIKELQEKIASLENLRDVLGEDVVTQKKAELQVQIDALRKDAGDEVESELVQPDAARGNGVHTEGGDYVARDKKVSAGKQGAAIGGNVGNVLIADTISFHEPPKQNSLPYPEARKQYLSHLIAAHQHLRLQGISAGSQPLSVSLEKVYVSLTAKDQRSDRDARGDHKSDLQDEAMRGGALTIASAMKDYRRLVVIGDPGCGKTTLLSFLALTYARQAKNLMTERLGLDEHDFLPVLLPLRDLGQHLLAKYSEAGKDGPAVLFNFLNEYFEAQKIVLPEDFFEKPLKSGKAIILLDGMDEVADKALRERIARLIEKFTLRYPRPRYVVTSRIVGYEGAARIGAEFGLVKVRDFSPAEVRQFVHDWTRVVESTLAGDDSEEILRLADEQSGRLIAAIESKPRVADLAVNPLLLTVIALVHRYRANLPERRSELFEEAVEVLLGNWDAAKPGMPTELDVCGIKLDSGDCRSLLEPVAFWMHARRQREIELDDLCSLLTPAFRNLASNGPVAAKKVTARFLQIINERSGMLVERGIGVYGFAHLTFQEYLAARALADREDALAYSMRILSDPWWREVILLQAGYLSTQGKRRVSELIAAILNADAATEPEPHQHLLLAAECLFDVGQARVIGDLLGEARERLKEQVDRPLEKGNKASVLQKVTAMNALARIETRQITSQFWRRPWGEPDWVEIPAGEFWMGNDTGDDDEKPTHRLSLQSFKIARVPVTNAQYALFVNNSGAKPPIHWRGRESPKGLENHPVVNVNWYDAVDYCQWLSEMTGRTVVLPSEAEWEKAARGIGDQRQYSWGDIWQELHANTRELGLKETTPVGLFLNGASPYGVLDLIGNVWEWTRSLFGRWDEGNTKHVNKFLYPYDLYDGREELTRGYEWSRVLRGGSWYASHRLARCVYRDKNFLDYYSNDVGFRVVLLPGFPLRLGGMKK